MESDRRGQILTVAGKYVYSCRNIANISRLSHKKQSYRLIIVTNVSHSENLDAVMRRSANLRKMQEEA